MTLNEYQHAAMKTAVPEAKTLTYAVLGLTNEAGEVAGKLKKHIRGDYRNKEQLFREHVVDELGDVLWYLADCCECLGVTLDHVASVNVLKLVDRQQRGVIRGDGDKR